MTAPRDIVVLGLSLSSSWGNGHATTWRALLKGVRALGHNVLFLERDAPWYAAHRDLPEPGFCELALYADLDGLAPHLDAIRRADAVIVGSYVQDGIAALDLVLSTARGRVAFYDIDTPITLAALAAGEPTYIAPRQIPELDVYFSFAGGPTLGRLERSFGARRALPLYCAADAELYRPLRTPVVYDLGYLGTYSADRQAGLERLLLEPARRSPGRRFVVGGSGYPADVAWPANVARIEHVPPTEHAGFYASQRLTLNLTRSAMRAAGWSPSVRLFEAAACGVPVVSDRSPGLDTLFAEGRSILFADDAGDVTRRIAMPDAALRSVAETARAVVLAGHTGLARARFLADSLLEPGLARSAPLPAPEPDPEPEQYGAMQ